MRRSDGCFDSGMVIKLYKGGNDYFEKDIIWNTF